MNAYVREPVNAFTHLGGACISIYCIISYACESFC